MADRRWTPKGRFMSFTLRRASGRLAVLSGAVALLAASAAPGAAPAARASGGYRYSSVTPTPHARIRRTSPPRGGEPWCDLRGLFTVIRLRVRQRRGPGRQQHRQPGHGELGHPALLRRLHLRYRPHDVALPAGGQLVVAQTTSGADNGCRPGNGLMDTSDIGPGGA